MGARHVTEIAVEDLNRKVAQGGKHYNTLTFTRGDKVKKVIGKLRVWPAYAGRTERSEVMAFPAGKTSREQMPDTLPASVACREGRGVSTKSKYGGIGFGRLIRGVLYVSMGNGAYRRRDDLSWVDDHGRTYREAVAKALGPDLAAAYYGDKS